MSDIFSMETFDGMFEFSFVKQNKNRFFRSLKVGSNLKLTIYSKLNIHLPFHRKNFTKSRFTTKSFIFHGENKG